MKKLLLGTSALIGATAIVASASAAPELTTSGGLDFRLVGGETPAHSLDAAGIAERNAAGADNDIGPNNSGFDFSRAVDSRSEIRFLAAAESDGGTRYGADIQYRYQAGSTDESYVFVADDWGRIHLGNDDGVADGVPYWGSISAGAYMIDGWETGIGRHGIGTGDSTKISYFSNDLNGFSFGASLGNSEESDAPIFDTVYEFRASYDTDFGGGSFSVGVGYKAGTAADQQAVNGTVRAYNAMTGMLADADDATEYRAVDRISGTTYYDHYGKDINGNVFNLGRNARAVADPANPNENLAFVDRAAAGDDVVVKAGTTVQAAQAASDAVTADAAATPPVIARNEITEVAAVEVGEIELPSGGQAFVAADVNAATVTGGVVARDAATHVIGTAAVAQESREDLAEYIIGASVSFGGFSIAAAYTDAGESGLTTSQVARGDEARSATGISIAYDLGGGMAVSLGTVEAETKSNNVDTTNRVTALDFGFPIMEGMVGYAGIAATETEIGTGANNSADATTYLVGTTVSF